MISCHHADHFEFSGPDFTVSFARNDRDVEAALRLRHEVYFREYLRQPLPGGIDRDKYDQQCLHLLIRHNHTGKLAGTCRLNTGEPDGYYSDTEFQIDNVLATPGKKLEIGRACILADFRNGAVFNLLIQGILNFACMTKTQQIFGCCSIPESLGTETLVYCIHRLKRNHLLPADLGIASRNQINLPELPQNIDGENQAWKNIQRNTHSPLSYYLLLGAKAAVTPFYDPIFHTYDFFVLLDLADMTAFGQRTMDSSLKMTNAAHVV